MTTPRKTAKPSVPSKPTPAPPKLQRGGPEARAEAMRLLAEGFTLVSVAESLGVDRGTVREWRDSPAGQAALVAARRAREATFADAAEDARRVLKEGATRAAIEIVDQLDHADPAVRSLAARTLLDRVGVPRTQRIEQVQGQEDTSALTDEELAAYEAAKRKIHRIEG